MGVILNTQSKVILSSVKNAPFKDAITILGQDINTVKNRLKKVGITYNGETSLKELAKKYNKPTFEIVTIISNKKN